MTSVKSLLALKDKQRVHIDKAINNKVAPAKKKHVRAIILGTFEAHSSSFFYATVRKFPLKANEVMCWKTLCVIYKLLQCGHSECLTDGIRFGNSLHLLQSSWHPSRRSSMFPTSSLCELVVKRLRIHKKYPVLSGNLECREGASALNALSDHLRQFMIDLMDMMERIMNFRLELLESVKKSQDYIDSKKGQMTITPLLVCLGDATAIYNLLVKLLSALHKKLGNEAMQSHRERFGALHEELKLFFAWVNSVQSIRSMVMLPMLPNKPPDFCIASHTQSTIKVDVIDADTETSGDEGDLLSADDINLSASNSSLADADKPKSEREAFSIIVEPDNSTWADFQDAFSCPFEDSEILREVELLKDEMDRLKSEANSDSQSLLDRIRTLEEEIKEVVQLKSTQEERLGELESALEQKSLELKKRNNKFTNFKDVYKKLRDEHVQTLRNLTNAQASELTHKQIADNLGSQLTELETQVNRRDDDNHQLVFLQNNLQQFAATLEDENLFVNVKGNPELVVLGLKRTQEQFSNYQQLLLDDKHDSSKLPMTVSSLCTDLCETLLHARYLAGSNPDGQNLRDLGQDLIKCLTRLQTDNVDPTFLSSMTSKLDQLSVVAQQHLKRVESVTNGQAEWEDALENEIHDTLEAINNASDLFQQWISSVPASTDAKDTHLNENILQNCSDLMSAISDLIVKSRDCQKSIPQEFPKEGKSYKRHHRWKQGLISAAKSVGACANVMVEVADGLMSGRFVQLERLLVVAHEVAASTTQLTMASRVKLPTNSDPLAAMQVSSNKVIKITGDVVNCVKSAMDVRKNQDFDFTGLTFTQARRMEIDSQIHVLQLEKQIETERLRLAQLRKLNYQEDTETVMEQKEPS